MWDRAPAPLGFGEGSPKMPDLDRDEPLLRVGAGDIDESVDGTLLHAAQSVWWDIPAVGPSGSPWRRHSLAAGMGPMLSRRERSCARP